VALQAWAHQLLDSIQQTASLLDQSQGNEAHSHALQLQRAKIDDASLTPSAQVLAQLQQGESFSQFALRQSKQHADYFRSQALSAEQQADFEAASARSLRDQADLEAREEGDFDSFAAAYQASILAPGI
jgi:glutamate--cysteine ligase